MESQLFDIPLDGTHTIPLDGTHTIPLDGTHTIPLDDVTRNDDVTLDIPVDNDSRNKSQNNIDEGGDLQNIFNGGLSRFVFKDTNIYPHTGIKRYLYYPTFTILVTIAELVLLIWSCTINGLVSTDLNPMIGPSAETLVYVGGKWTPYIINQSQWWRLITAMFLHAGIIHFITNAIAQIIMCGIMEMRYGTHIIGPVYILTGISGNLWSAIFVPNFVTVGASGALFGIIGLWTIEIFKHFKLLQRPWFTLISCIIVILTSFGLGLLPYVDNYAHLGGYVAGLQLGMLLIPNPRVDKKWKRFMVFSIYILGAILFIATFVCMFCVLYLVKEPVSVWCPTCKYFNCIPNVVNGIDWCEGF